MKILPAGIMYDIHFQCVSITHFYPCVSIMIMSSRSFDIAILLKNSLINICSHLVNSNETYN